VRRFVVVVGSVALALAGAVGVAAGGAAGASGASPPAIPGATYEGKETKLVVDALGKSATVPALPVHAKCKNGHAPSNEGQYGAVGLGPFPILKDGTFTNIRPGTKPAAGQTVIKAKFMGAKVSGTVIEPPLKDPSKGFDCERFEGSWTATRVPGTGDTTKPGATYATDDFAKATSGFDTFNEEAGYAEYLHDKRFRIGTRSQTALASLRKEPETATADISVTTGYTSGSGADGAGLACLGTGARDYIAAFVSVDGQAHLVRYYNGSIVESIDPKPIPSGLLKTGPQAQNQIRLVCVEQTEATTQVDLSLNGTKVAGAIATVAGTGKTGVFVSSSSGNSEFTFSHFSVRKPRS
jgi:hypothetical protein